MRLLVELGSSGCGSMWSKGATRSEQEPFAPSAKSNKSDLIFVRTGDRRYYYVIDKRRRACFFHAPMYGKKHFVEIACERLPEYEELTGKAPQGEPHLTERPRREARRSPPSKRPTPSPKVADPSPERAAPEPGVRLSNETRERFRRAWVQHFCARRSGAEEPLEVILSRHGLSQAEWSGAKDEFSRDQELWQALTAEALEACP